MIFSLNFIEKNRKNRKKKSLKGNTDHEDLVNS